MDCIKNNIEIIKRQNNFICTFKMAYNNTCNSINTGYSPFFVSFKKESKIIKYTYTKQHKHSNPVPVLLYNYYFLYKVIYNPAILFIPTNPNSDYALMYGSLASTITGGNFLEGAAIGLVVTALNHALHAALDPDPTQQQKGNKENTKKLRHDKIKVTFDPGADNEVTKETAEYFNKILDNAEKEGIKKVNISSTTNHTSNKGKSAHDFGKAFDINYVNGEHVSQNNNSTLLFQNIIKNTPGFRENFGPYLILKTDADFFASDKLIFQHKNHIHVSIQ